MSEDKFTGKTELRGRLSYALTDGCGNLLYCIIGSFLLYFYTDVFGLSVAVTGTLLLATRLMDAIDAPLWGFIVNHTKTKYGQSRPYFLWLCVPFAVFMWYGKGGLCSGYLYCGGCYLHRDTDGDYLHIAESVP